MTPAAKRACYRALIELIDAERGDGAPPQVAEAADAEGADEDSVNDAWAFCANQAIRAIQQLSAEVT